MAKSTITIDGQIAGKALQDLKEKVKLLRKEISGLTVGSKEYNDKVSELRKANDTLNSHRKEILGIGASYDSTKTGLKGLVKEFMPFAGTLGLITAGIGGVVAATMSWFKNNREMEKSLSSLRSITGASTDDINFYKETAIEISTTSTKSAAEVVEAYKLIGSARPELLKNREALADVTKETIALAEAGEIDLASAAQAMAGSMNQFNLGAEHSSRIINALAAGAKEGAAEINDQTASIEKFGTVAAANNVTFEESVALTELMAEKNIKNSEAGTQLRNVLLTVATASTLDEKALKSMEQYGVNLEIVQNKALPLEDRLRELAKVQGDQNALVRIFGKENVVAGQTVLGNVDKFKQLTDAVTGTNEAYKQQEINNDNLDGAIKKLGNAWQTFTLSMNGSKGATSVLKDAIKFLATNLESIISIVGKLVLAFVSYKAILGGARLVQVLFNAELRKQAFGMTQTAGATDAAGKSVKNYGAAMKAIGWTMLIAFAIEQAMAFWDIASGASDARDAVERYNKMQEQGAKFGKESVQQIREKFETEKQELDFLASKTIENGGISQKEHQKRLAELNREIDERIKGEIRLANEMKRNASLPMKEDKAVINKENQILKELIALQKERATAAIDSKIEENKSVATLTNQQKQQQINAEKQKNAELKKLNDELNRVLAKTKELSENEAFQKFLQSYDEGLEKEMVLLEKSIEDKYEKEIEAALKLMEQKGDVGIKATEAFNTLMLTMQEELEREGLALAKKYNKEKQAQYIANAKETHEILLSNQEKYETSLADLKVSQAEISLSQVLQGDVSGQRKALENLKNAELEKNEITKFWLLNRLNENERTEKATQEQRFKDGAVSKEDYEKIITDITATYVNERELVENNSQTKIVEINKTTADEIIEIDQEKMEEISNNLQTIGGLVAQFSDLALQSKDAEIQKEENNYKRSKKALNAKLKSGVISESDYNKQIETLDKDYNLKKNELLRKQFNLKKAVDIIQVTISTALAAVNAYAEGGPYAGPILAAIVAGFGAAQIGLISSQEFPESDQYNDGGFTNVTGAKDGKRYRAKNMGRLAGGMTPDYPSMVLVSETKPEYFVPGGLLESNPQVANYVGMIEAIRTNKTPQFNDGGFTKTPTASTSVPNDMSNIIAQNTQIMNLLYQEIRNGVGVNFSDERIEDLEKAQTRLASVKS